MASGDYTKTVWQNGAGVGHPAINEDNLNNIEDKIDELDSELAYSGNYRFRELLEYFWNKNCKIIHLFDDEDDWTGSSGGETIRESSEPRTGNQDVGFYDNNDVGGTIGIYDAIDSIDLTKFNDGSSSSTSDIISISLTILDDTLWNSVTVKLGDDAANYYYKTFTVNAGDLNVTYEAKKSDFTTVGAPSGWDDITYVLIEGETAALASGSDLFCRILSLYRNDPDNDGSSGPFQIYKGSISGWENFFTESSENWHIYLNPFYNSLGLQCLSSIESTDDFDSLKVKSNVISFVWKTLMSIQDEGTYQSTSMTWYVNSNNYAVTYIDSDTFYLVVNEAGVPTSHSVALDNSLIIKEKVEIKLEKNNDTIIATMFKNGEIDKILEHETTISSTTSGDLFFGIKDGRPRSFIHDFLISNINNMDLDFWDKPKIVRKMFDEVINNSDTLQDDNELYFYLPPNSFFEVEANLYVDANSDTPDVSITFDITGGAVENTRRIGCGMGTSSTNGYNSEYSNFAAEPVGSGGNYGVDSTGYSSIIQKFLVYTNHTGGKIQLKWAQYTAHASDTTMKEGSYIKVTKVDRL